VSDTISFRQQDGIATLSFDNPERRNALGSVELEAIEKGVVRIG
jgi:enoyl-CoA hydratase/carnithine racemase